MSYRNKYSQNLYEEQQERYNVEKIALVLFLSFGLILIGITCQFLFEFLQSYKSEINEILYYLVFTIIVSITVVISFLAIYFISILWVNFEIKNANKRHIQEKLRAEMANNKLVDSTQSQMNSGLVYLYEQTTEYGTVKFKPLTHRSSDSMRLEHLHEDAQTEIKDTLLDDIGIFQRMLIVGGQGTGKTTLLQHIAKQRSYSSRILVLDSHNTRGKWDSNYRVVGDGRDYKAIETELHRLLDVINKRYIDLSSGLTSERGHEIITVISDEWTTLSKNLNNLDKILLPLLTESRKVGIDFMLATHSDRASALGLKGAYDLKENFDGILHLKLVGGKRLIYITVAEETFVYNHCGEYFNKNIHYNNNKLDTNLDKELNKDELIIKIFNDLKERGDFSWNKLSLAIYGKKGGHYTDQLKRILKLHNIEV